VPIDHDLDAETELWDTYAESAFDPEAEPVFNWTQYQGHGPGPELLGAPARVLEIGCGTGRALVHLARTHGSEAHGVDLSPAMIKKISERWAADTRVCFHHGDVLTHLSTDEHVYDAVYSNFGAAWFTDPTRLFPLVHARLRPGGTFIFSQPPAIPGAYGPQGMYKGGFAGKAMFIYRYSYRPAVWERFLTRAGFRTAQASVLEAPTPGHIGTLIVRATT
jgi:SAM-dependent methyltransferase